MITENNIAIKLNNISKTFHIKDKQNNTIRDKALSFFAPNKSREIKALKNINLEINKGEMFGIIGRNGSGKSTLISILAGGIRPDSGGKVELNGKTIRLSLGLGFDKELTARENIYVNGSIMGLSFKKIGSKFKEIIEFSELHDFVDTRLKYFSSGMRSRLSFAIALHTDAEILLMDEFFGGVGDENFKKKSDEIFKRTFLDGRTIIHVSHSLSTISKYCQRAMLIENGELIKIGDPNDVITTYRSII
jgi:ABC-2 type transport system ATP-binding protein